MPTKKWHQNNKCYISHDYDEQQCNLCGKPNWLLMVVYVYSVEETVETTILHPCVLNRQVLTSYKASCIQKAKVNNLGKSDSLDK